MKSTAFSDLEQRIRLSKIGLLQTVIIILAWFTYFIWIGSTGYAYAVLMAGALSLPAGLFHWIGWNYFARVYWLVTLPLAFLGMSIFFEGPVSPEIFFFFLIGLPFLLLSWNEERTTLIAVVALQVVIGFFSLSLDYIGVPGWLPSQRLDEAQAVSINWGFRITVGALLVLQMIDFSKLNGRINLRASKAMQDAETAARSKGEFLANMSHEIRTPMNGIIGMIEVLETMDLNAQQARSVSTVRNSAFSLLRILDDILDASQIEAGKLNVEKTKVELRPLLEGVSQTLQLMADERGAELRLLIDRKLPEWIWTDSGRLRQVLLNLLSNAIKYSAQNISGHKGTVVLNARNEDGKNLRITIKDNGIGMNEEVLARLFEPFMQGEQSTRRRVGGTGLGLVISRNLVQLMGGDITVESTEGEGTRMIVRLPLEVADGPSRLPNLDELNVVSYGMADELIREGMEHMLGSGGIRNRFIDDLETAESQDPEIMNNAVVVFPPMEEEKRTPLQNRMQELFPGASFIHCSPVRFDRFGLIAKNTYRIQIFPMMTSELYHALGVLSGRIAADPHAADMQGDDRGVNLVPADHRVLVVEDNEINKAVLSKQLEILGYPHDLASDGVEGFAKWQSGNFDLVLTDCHMPNMDGFEMVTAIRQCEQHQGMPPVPIIAITANALEGEANKCLAAGMNAYLAKPVELEALKTQLSKLLRKPAKVEAT